MAAVRRGCLGREVGAARPAMVGSHSVCSKPWRPPVQAQLCPYRHSVCVLREGGPCCRLAQEASRHTHLLKAGDVPLASPASPPPYLGQPPALAASPPPSSFLAHTRIIAATLMRPTVPRSAPGEEAGRDAGLLPPCLGTTPPACPIYSATDRTWPS